VREIRYRIDVNSLEHQPVSELQLNEIGVISMESQRDLFFDPYAKNRATGSFILIDSITNETVGAGMILQPQASGIRTGRVTAVEREALRGHGGLAILLPPGSLELAWSLERRLFGSCGAALDPLINHWQDHYLDGTCYQSSDHYDR